MNFYLLFNALLLTAVYIDFSENCFSPRNGIESISHHLLRNFFYR